MSATTAVQDGTSNLEVNSDNEQNEDNSHLKGNYEEGLQSTETSMANGKLEHNPCSPSFAGGTHSYMKDVITSLHRATMASAMSGIVIRDAALVSLVNIVESENTETICDIAGHTSTASNCQYSLIVLQTWLDQFARTNGGSSPSEYAGVDRVRLLHTLKVVVDKMDVLTGSQDNVALCAAVGRVINMATEEMTKTNDIIDEIQQPCSEVLVRLCRARTNCGGCGSNKSGGGSYIERVMEAIMAKFQPGNTTHYYAITTLSAIAVVNPIGIVPFLKDVISTVLSNMKATKKENLRYAFCIALSRFSEAILDYEANIQDAPDSGVNKTQFTQEFDLAHEILFASWLGSSRTIGDHSSYQTRYAVMEALGQMGPLLSDERIYKNTTQVVSLLITLYKRSGIEPYHVTQCVSSLLKAIVERNSQILDGIVEQLLTALFVQVCQYSVYSTTLQVSTNESGNGVVNTSETVDSKRRNHYEVLRCYDVLVKSHGEKLITGLIARLSSSDETVRLAGLTVFKHMMNSSMDSLQSRMQSDIFTTLHSRLGEGSNRVRKMLAQLTALLGRLGYLDGEKGRDFLEFIVKLCALPVNIEGITSDATKQYSSATNLMYFFSDLEGTEVTNANLRDMCDNILQLLTNNVDAMEPVLWPHLLEYLLSPDYVGAVPSVIKSLAQLAQRKRQTLLGYMVDWTSLDNVSGPYVLYARLLVLAAVPFREGRGAHILSFLQHFAPNISKHLSALWDQRIPLLQHYLETHTSSNGTATSSWDQLQWEEWLLALLDDTIAEIDLDDWTCALATTMVNQMTLLYQMPDQLAEKCFLLRCLGRVSRSAKSGTLRIMDNLSSVFAATQHSDDMQVAACSKAFGFCSSRHLKLVLEKLESLLTEAGSGKRMRGPSFFANLLRDTKGENIAILARCTILSCVGEVAVHADHKELYTKVDEITQKFVIPALTAAHPSLKLAAIKATADIARAMQKIQSAWNVLGPGNENKAPTNVKLAHHNDLILESIECMKAKNWQLKEKQVAMETTLELIRLPPQINQVMRCSLLKACFTAVFPSLFKLYLENVPAATSDHPKTPTLLRRLPLQSTISSQSAAASAGMVGSSTSFTNHSVPLMIHQMLDSLLILVQELLLQELQQSTLDEIFTLVEPYLKLSDHLPREMAVTILHTAVQVFLDKYPFEMENSKITNVPKDVDEDSETSFCGSSFAPGAYIAGCLVPRCFDTSRHVQATALQSLHSLMEVIICFENLSKSNGQCNNVISPVSPSNEMANAMLSLTKIKSACTPMSASMMQGLSGDNLVEAVSPDIVSQIVANILSLGFNEDQLLPLVHSLIEGLSDEVGGCAYGTSLILGSLLESRGGEEDIKAQATVLVGKLHAKLLSLDGTETKQRTLIAIQIIAKHTQKAVVTSLLADHQLPYDEVMIDIWKVLSENKDLASVVMNHLIDLIINTTDDSVSEINDSNKQLASTKNDTIVAKHFGLAAVIALGTMFLSREMENVIENEFAEVFVPLLLAMSRYAGVIHYEQLNVTSLSASIEPSTLNDKLSEIMPYSAALTAMKSFLCCKGCSSVAMVMDASCKDLSSNVYYHATNSSDFAEFVYTLIEPIIADFPQYLSRLTRVLQPVLVPTKFSTVSAEDERRALLSTMPCHRIAAASVFTQLLRSESEVDLNIMEIAIDTLLHVSRDKIALIRIICLEGLSVSKLTLSIDQSGRLQKKCGLILTTFLKLIGDDFENNVNYYALTGLAKILPQMPLDVVNNKVRDIVLKIFPFFDGGRNRTDSAAAIQCFANLAQFTLDHLNLKEESSETKELSAKIKNENIALELKETFIELIQQVLVSLLLHANDDGADDRTETRNASRKALENIFLIFKGDEHLDNVREWYLKENLEDLANMKNKRAFNYIDFLKEFCRTECTHFNEMFPVHVNTALSYFRIGDARLRTNAVQLVTLLLVEGCSVQRTSPITRNCGMQFSLKDRGIDPEIVCTSMSKLLTDPDVEVRTVASANLGKVFVVLGPKKPMAKPQMRTDVNCMSESMILLGSTTSIPIMTDNLDNDLEAAANHKLENGID